MIRPKVRGLKKGKKGGGGEWRKAQYEYSDHETRATAASINVANLESTIQQACDKYAS